MRNAFHYFESHYLVEDLDYPYYAGMGSCRYEYVRKTKAKALSQEAIRKSD